MNNKNININSKGIILSTFVLFSVLLIFIPTNVYADEISITGVGLEETTILTLKNDSTYNINTLRIWLQGDFNFESFKTENGWVGEKNQAEVIIFTSSEVIEAGESVKFGIKTDKINPIINWKAVNEKDEVIKTGITDYRGTIPSVKVNPDITIDNTNTPQIKNNNGEIFPDSTFKIIPDKPNSGSTIRVIGEYFDSSQEFDFYVNQEKIGDFKTNTDGSFVTTMKIPKIDSDERTEFKVKNNQGQEKILSIRIGNDQNRILEDENVSLTVEGINDIVNRGNNLKIYGTAIPNKSIIVKILDPQQDITNTRTTTSDSQGKWELSENVLIPWDAPFGKYSITVSDGNKEILKNWQVQTDKIVVVNPSKIFFKSGDLMKFNGTAVPNNQVEIILEDSFGNEIFTKNIDVDELGNLEFEYQTKENDDEEGTWTIIATQGNEKEFIYFGYGEMGTIPINFEFDKSNYKSSDTAIIDFLGKPSENLTMLIISPAGNIKNIDGLKEISIQLRADGRSTYELKLSGYESGIYTAVVKKSGVETTETFSVGLQIGSGNIEANITKTEYQQGESILILGNTNPNSLMTITLVDPNGSQIKSLEIPSDSVGTFTENRFKVPDDAIAGKWEIKIVSGTNSENMEFNVHTTNAEGITVNIPKEVKAEELLEIKVITTFKTSIIVEITDDSGESIGKISCNTTKEFVCEVFWTVPKNTLPGTYTATIDDAKNSRQVTFDVIPN
jgi:hypothetical protein